MVRLVVPVGSGTSSWTVSTTVPSLIFSAAVRGPGGDGAKVRVSEQLARGARVFPLQLFLLILKSPAEKPVRLAPAIGTRLALRFLM
jgi:hypothetical protein